MTDVNKLFACTGWSDGIGSAYPPERGCIARANLPLTNTTERDSVGKGSTAKRDRHKYLRQLNDVVCPSVLHLLVKLYNDGELLCSGERRVRRTNKMRNLPFREEQDLSQSLG